MDRIALAGSGADITDPAMAALYRRLAELTIEKDAEIARASARADAEIARADAEKARADAAEEAIVAEKRRASAAILVQPAVPKPRRICDLIMAQASERVLHVESPTSEVGGVFLNQLAVFAMDAKPQVLSLAALDQTRSLGALSTHEPASLLLEHNMYPFLTSFLPAWVNGQHRPAHLTKGSLNAKSLFIGVGNPPVLPESLTSSTAFHPAFNAEAKPATSARDMKSAGAKMYDELVTYVTLGIVGSMFVAVPEGRHRFFTRPPVGYGLAALAHVGYLVAVEWVGRLFVSVVSQPFFLGSPEHEAAVAALPDYDYEHSYEDMAFAGIPVLTWPRADGTIRVIWRAEGAEGDDFFKVIRWDSYDADHFKHMLQVYTALSAAWDACPSDAVPPSLLRARMLFGVAEVCVKMPWVEGRDAEAADLAAGGCAVEPVARAIVWLAQHGLLYVDLRLPNVRIAAHDRAFLVDYDDMAVCEPPASAEELITALLRDPVVATIGWASVAGERALVAVLDAIRRCW